MAYDPRFSSGIAAMPLEQQHYQNELVRKEIEYMKRRMIDAAGLNTSANFQEVQPQIKQAPVQQVSTSNKKLLLLINN